MELEVFFSQLHYSLPCFLERVFLVLLSLLWKPGLALCPTVGGCLRQGSPRVWTLVERGSAGSFQGPQLVLRSFGLLPDAQVGETPLGSWM